MVLSRLRGAVTDARRRPALLALCGLVGAGEAATWLLVLPFFRAGSNGAVLGLILAQRAALVGLLTALLPAMYAATRRELGSGKGGGVEQTVGDGALASGGVGATLQAVIERGESAGPALFVSMVVSRVVAAGTAFAAALVLVGALGVVDTAVVWTDAYLGVGTDRALLATLGVSGAILVPALLARGAVGLHDLAAIDGEHSPVEAALWSLRAWRGNAGALVSYALVRGTLLALPVGVAVLVFGAVGDGTVSVPTSTSAPGALAVAAIAFVGTTALTRAILACYQRDVYDSATGAGGETDPDAGGVPRSRRVVLAGIVLVAAIAGAALVRTADVHPAPEDVPDSVVPENARTTVETAVERTAARDRFIDQRTEIRNGSTGEWVTVNRYEALLDRSDRQLMFYGQIGSGRDAPDRTIYATDGRLASLRSAEPPAPPDPHYLRFERGSWSVLVGPPYGWAIDEPTAGPPVDGWRLIEATGERLVYRLEGDALATAEFRELVRVSEDRAVAIGDGARVTLVVDRETLTVRRMSARATVVASEDAGGRETDLRWERQVNWLGNVAVERPAALPSPSVLAVFWDAVYY